MLETILLIIIFITGTYFGSFYTLATYRIPKHENITYKHSYCPSCNHKLGLFDLFPIFSYIFLGGKCRYCKQKIGIRYFLFEILTGIVFVLFAISLRIDIYNINVHTIFYFFIAVLYLSILFIIAGIEKEQNILPHSVLMFGSLVSILYIVYSYTQGVANVYEYVIYLIIMILLFLIDFKFFKKNLKHNYYIQLIILLLYTFVFTGIYVGICTVIITIISIGFRNILLYIKKKNSKVKSKHNKSQIAFFICVSNIVATIICNLMLNYMCK